MECEVIIKEEPLDELEEEITYDDVRHEAAWEEVKKYMNGDRVGENIGTYIRNNFPNNSSIINEQPDQITVRATEHIQVEDTLLEEDYAHANLHKSTNDLISPSTAKTFVPNLSFQCRKNCVKKFTTLTERAFHESHEHACKPRTIKCNFCNKYFDSFFALARHMSEHRNDQKYVCTHCTECYSSYQDLQEHWKSSIDCFKNEFDTKRDSPNNLIEGTYKISILKPPQSKNTTTKQENILQQNQQKIKEVIEENFPLSKKLSLENSTQQDECSKVSTPLSFLSLLPLSKPKPISFAEERKAFASKYQLKSSLVAKKRTSAVVINPVNIKKQKRSKTSQFEIISKYVVPNAIGSLPGNPSDLNIKIKEEPKDDYDETFSIESESSIYTEVKVKSEPIDDYIEVKNEPVNDPIAYSEEWNEHAEAKSIYTSKFEGVKTHPLLPSNDVLHATQTIPLKNLKIIKLDQTSSKSLENKTLPLLSTKVDLKLQNTDNKIVKLKNFKILKLSPNSKIFKLESITSLNKETPTLKSNNNQTESISKQQSAVLNSFVPIKQPFKAQQQDVNNETISVKKELSTSNEEERERMIEDSSNLEKGRKRINCVPRHVLEFIESQPQTAKMIENLQRQIQIAACSSQSLSLTERNLIEKSEAYEKEDVQQQQSSECNSVDNSVAELPPPPSLFLLISDVKHSELYKARHRYRNYRFSWICPLCPKRCDRKTPFVGHLHKFHNMCREDYENLTVEVRPFPAGDFEKAPVNNLENYKTKFQCPNCSRYCSSRSMLNDHIAGNCGRVPLYRCTVCSKTFFSGGTLACHMTIHSGELPHKCNYCDKRFRTRGQVTVHHRTHTGERPFACPVCSQRFTHRETLISHLSRHIGMKRYRCYACGKHFSCVSGLKTHHQLRPDSCGLVKLNTRAVGPRVRVVKGQVHFEPQPEINPYLRTEDPQDILSEIQNIQNISV